MTSESELFTSNTDFMEYISKLFAKNKKIKQEAATQSLQSLSLDDNANEGSGPQVNFLKNLLMQKLGGGGGASPSPRHSSQIHIPNLSSETNDKKLEENGFLKVDRDQKRPSLSDRLIAKSTNAEDSSQLNQEREFVQRTSQRGRMFEDSSNKTSEKGGPRG